MAIENVEVSNGPEREPIPSEIDIVFFEDSPEWQAILKNRNTPLNCKVIVNMEDARALLANLDNGSTRLTMSAFVDGNLRPGYGDNADGREIIERLRRVRDIYEKHGLPTFDILSFASGRLEADVDRSSGRIIRYKIDTGAFQKKLEEYDSRKDGDSTKK